MIRTIPLALLVAFLSGKGGLAQENAQLGILGPLVSPLHMLLKRCVLMSERPFIQVDLPI